MDRRMLLSCLAAASVAPAACLRRADGNGDRLSILMLGGTNFVGPHLVQAALERGHTVTLFNRGHTNPDLFPRVERLKGDRYPDRNHGLSALETTRTWDAVIDTWQAEPGCVDLTARLLAHRTERYVYVSSIATYRSFRGIGITETGPMIDAKEHIASFDGSLDYRVRKRAAEQAVERSFGGAATLLRCTSIVGFHRGGAASEQVAGYWVPRFLAREPLLAPDDPTAVIQLIDVRDMAEFAIRAIEQDFGGAYNMVGPEKPLPLRDYLLALNQATGHRSQIVWVAPAFLLERGVRPFDDVPNWIPADDPEPGFYRISNSKSLAHGLRYRPLLKSISDAIGAELLQVPVDGIASEPEGPGLRRARERELIEEWVAHQG